MGTITNDQSAELTFLTGVDGSGRLAPTSFWTWNNDTPASYGSRDYAAKWGSSTPGTGATITYIFDPASHWTSTEENAFVATMHLWSDVANVRFVQGPDSQANYYGVVTISRGSNGSAEGGTTSSAMPVGSAYIGTAHSGSISIDTSVAGFGPLGASFSDYGGYPWTTLIHEEGHILGLGHAGPYDDGVTSSTIHYTDFDTLAWSVMSYNDVSSSNPADTAATPAAGYSWGSSYGDNGHRYADTPTTWMPLDILAAQRLYGAATSGPLQGGQVFGFNSNIDGDTRQFFDFTVNTRPIVTLWDAGGGNTLDLTGFSSSSTVNLADGSFSSVGGLTDNLAIAYGTRIDTVIAGPNTDILRGNDDGDYLEGGGGGDVITGGAGNDHIYGNAATSVQGATDNGDEIATGGGDNYVNGNGGDDHITGGDGSDRLYGGSGNDVINAGNGSNHLNGNLGDDLITAGNGDNYILGGQGNDTISVGSGNNQLFGNAGNDTVRLGSGIELISGGDGSDLFVFPAGSAAFARADQWNGWLDEITDFQPGQDRINLGFTVSDGHVLAGSQGFDTVSAAESYAQGLLNGTGTTGEVAAVQVGGATILFWDQGGGSDAITSALKLDGTSVGAIGSGSFTTATAA